MTINLHNSVYIIASENRKCANCGKTTRLIDIYYEVPICSWSCQDDFTKKLDEKWNDKERWWLKDGS